MANIYKLFSLESAELIDRKEYTNGKKAAKIASRLSKRTGRKYQVRKIDPEAGDPNWRDREMARFQSGEYYPLVDEFQAIEVPDHYAHISKKAPDLIAYTKDEEKGRADLQSRLSITAYIQLCLQHPVVRARLKDGADLHGIDVDKYIECFLGESWQKDVTRKQQQYAIAITSPIEFIGPVKDPTDEEEVGDVAAEIVRAYTKYDPNSRALTASCMRAEADYFACRRGGSRVHPTIAYASPDVALAVMRDKEGRTIARALVWPERKITNRIYSDNSAMWEALKALGYSKAGYYGDQSLAKSFKGARLRRIEDERASDAFIMPYIDGNHAVDDDGEWLTMGGHEIDCARTDGLAYSNRTRCENCDDSCDEDDMSTVYTNSSRSQSQLWCQGCVDNNAFYCNGFDCFFDMESVDSCEVDGSMYSQRYADNYATFCDRSQEYTFRSTYAVVINQHGDTETWSEDFLDETFEYDGTYYSTRRITCVPVVSQRYVFSAPHGRWRYLNGDHVYCVNALAYYTDLVYDVPLYLIEDGTVEAAEGSDGRYYMLDYVDHYPLARPRMIDDPIVPSWVETYLNASHPTMATRAAVQEEIALHRILEAERAALQILALSEELAQGSEPTLNDDITAVMNARVSV